MSQHNSALLSCGSFGFSSATLWNRTQDSAGYHIAAAQTKGYLVHTCMHTLRHHSQALTRNTLHLMVEHSVEF